MIERTTPSRGDRGQLELPLETTIGPYRIIGLLGRGGMGSVYLAEQSQPVARRVAVKIVNAAVLDRERLERFAAERRALARLQHGNIAQLFEAGTTDDGHPFFVMEVVEGQRITTFCDDHGLGVDERLDLFCQVCRGVQHAHEKGILHRDLKPSNILVAEVGGRAVPKIIDFGIAKALDAPLTEATLITGDRVMGTPAYLSPEALDRGAEAPDLDTRSDVYSLGVILYEILVGLRPFDRKGDPLIQVVRRISEGEVSAPSTRLSTLDAATEGQVATARSLDLGALRRQLKGDLDWIVLKAMARDRKDRYASPSELEADILRHLRNQPVEASPPSAAYRALKFVRRNRGLVVGACLVVLSLCAGLVTTSREARRANRAAAQARSALAETQEVSRFLVDLFKVSDPGRSRGSTVTARELLDRGAAAVAAEGDLQPLARARFMLTIAEVYEQLGLYDEARPLVDGALALREAELGPDHPEVATTLLRLGSVAWRQGRFAEAEAALERSLAVRAGGGETLAVAEALSSLANLYRDLDRHGEAEPLFRRALAIQEAELGPEAPELAQTLNNLAILLELDERFVDAESLHRRALAIREAALGPDHPDVGQSLNNLAILCRTLERYDEAEALYRRTIAIWERALGPDHPHVGAVINNLGALYLNQDRVDEAEPLYRRGLEIKEAALGPDHPGVASSLNNLGQVALRQGRLDDARTFLDRALAIREAHFGPDHRGVASVLANLARLDTLDGHPRRAEESFRRAITIYERELGGDAFALATPLANYADLLRDSGRRDEAGALYDRSIAILETQLGPDHAAVKEVRDRASL